MQRGHFFCVLLIIMMLTGATSISGETLNEICVPVRTMVLEPPSTIEPKRSPVEFPHSRHLLVYGCKKCHHKWTAEEQVSSCTVSGCHGPTKPPKGARRKGRTWLDYSKEQIKYFKYAYHKQCIGCHKKIKIRNRALLDKSEGKAKPKLASTGPTYCLRCHPKGK